MTTRRHRVARAPLPNGGAAHFDLGPDPAAAAPRSVTLTFDEQGSTKVERVLAELLASILSKPPAR